MVNWACDCDLTEDEYEDLCDRAVALTQAAQDEPEQDGAAGVKEHVDNVISARFQAPELILDPVGGVGERIILRRGVALGIG